MSVLNIKNICIQLHLRLNINVELLTNEKIREAESQCVFNQIYNPFKGIVYRVCPLSFVQFCRWHRNLMAHVPLVYTIPAYYTNPGYNKCKQPFNASLLFCLYGATDENTAADAMKR